MIGGKKVYMNDSNNILTQKDSRVRGIMAATSDVSQDVLLQLTSDSSVFVRLCVAGRKDLSERVLLRLSVDRSSRVRLCVAGRKGPLPDSVLEVLKRDPLSDVRSYLAVSKETPDNVMRFLAFEDSDPKVRCVAEFSLKHYENQEDT